MNKKILIFLCWALLPAAMAAAAATTNPAVVMVLGYHQANRTHLQATGFFIDPQGDVATSDHILPGTSQLTIRTISGKGYAVTAVLARDTYHDLAILATTGAAAATPVTLAPELPATGSAVAVTGHPLGHAQDTTQGVITALFPLERGGRLLQFSAPIAPGSSGSPLFDARGRVTGVAAFILYLGDQAPPYNYAIAAAPLRRLLARVRARRPAVSAR